jgi:hypothetical protein
MAGIVSAKDVALLLEVFLLVDFSASVALLKHLKTSGTSLAARKRLGTDKPHHARNDGCEDHKARR